MRLLAREWCIRSTIPGSPGTGPIWPARVGSRGQETMQAGLVDTYHRPMSSRHPMAWACSALLVASYLLLYFGGNRDFGFEFDPVQRFAEVLTRRLGLPRPFSSKWTLYGFAYTAAMIAGGLYFLRRHGNSR